MPVVTARPSPRRIASTQASATTGASCSRTATVRPSKTPPANAARLPGASRATPERNRPGRSRLAETESASACGANQASSNQVAFSTPAAIAPDSPAARLPQPMAQATPGSDTTESSRATPQSARRGSSPSSRAAAKIGASNPGSNQERMPTTNSHGTSPVPNTRRCACSRYWKSSSGNNGPGAIQKANSRSARAMARMTASVLINGLARIPTSLAAC